MPLDPNIPLSVRAPQFMGAGDVLNLQNMASAGQMQALQLREAQRESQTRNALRLLSADPENLDANTGVWSEKGVRRASQIDPFLGMQIAQQRATSLKTLGEVARMQRVQPLLERVMGALQGGGVPLSGIAAQAAGGPMSRGSMPSIQDIQAALLSGDPGAMAWGKAMLEAQKGVAARPGAPVVNQLTGEWISPPTPTVPQGVQLTMGPNGLPQAGVVPGYSGAMTTLSGIPNLSQGLITVKTSGGQDIQLTQPEYVAWQQTGRLPERYGGTPAQTRTLPANVPESDRAAYEAVASGAVRTAYPQAAAKQPGLGTVGATQTEEDRIRQERQRAGGKALDEAFAKDYSAFVQGGASDAAKQLAQLKDVIGALKAKGANLTGPMIGSLPDGVLKWFNQDSIAMRERVEEVVQRALRSILGAQFTEKEGERLIARAYNPNLKESENAIRVQRLFDQLENAFNNKKAAADEFAKSGTLEGWTGKIPSISDFDVNAPAAAPAAATGWTPEKQRRLEELRRRRGAQ